METSKIKGDRSKKQESLDKDGKLKLGRVFLPARRPMSVLEAAISSPESHHTNTYEEQDEVEETLLDIYRNSSERSKPGDPTLYREKHSVFLRRGLKYLSDAYESLDASRPWLCYWILHSMNLLGVKLSKEESINISRFLDNCQDKTVGGFGGGPQQFAHLAATYAAVNALVSLGIPEAFAVINRDRLHTFLKSMKLKNGSFRMHRGGEVDVRAVYCAVVVAHLTNLCSEDLFAGTAEWVVRCQTYEGGFAGYIGGEAHGGYTFCAAATLVLLKKVRLMDQDALLKWLSNRQLGLEGGFQGRTNKLVDGCYSFWQGASFCLLGPDGIGFSSNEVGSDMHWLFNELALQEYILICCQHPSGGLIDKPGKQRDYYHTCYTLSGLSISQHSPGATKVILGNVQNELKELHPVYNLTIDVVEKAQVYFYESAQSVVTEINMMDVTDESNKTEGGASSSRNALRT